MSSSVEAFQALKATGVLDNSRKGKLGLAAASEILARGEALLASNPTQAGVIYAGASQALAIITGFHILAIAVEDAGNAVGGKAVRK